MTSPAEDSGRSPARRPQVVIVGGGFGGLQAARGLRHADATVVVVDRVNHHLFQPLLYQVCTALLAPGDIAPALRTVLADSPNTSVVLGDVTTVDPVRRVIDLTTIDSATRPLDYDYLVLAVGAEQDYFGHDEWRRVAPPMKTLAGAVDLRDRLLRAFESADVTDDGETRRGWLTFVIVGAGPTGVEMAGQIAALARRTLRREFHRLNPDEVRIVLVDAGDRVLAPFAESLQTHTRDSLAALGVEIVLGHAADMIDEQGITLVSTAHPEDASTPARSRISARTVIWATGVSPVGLTALVAEAANAALDDQGRIMVGADCSIKGHDEVFAIGDMANVQNLPGLAEPAMQEGRFVAKVIDGRLRGLQPPDSFRYRDLGTMATIAPLDAVAQIGPLRLRGKIAKMAWAGVHLAFLVGWGNRLAVLIDWAQTVLFRSRRHQVILGGARPTTGPD